MYRLLHWLFGWDYIAWRNTCDQGISRIYRDYSGTVFYWQYKSISVSRAITKPSDVLWLTCKPEKYLP